MQSLITSLNLILFVNINSYCITIKIILINFFSTHKFLLKLLYKKIIYNEKKLYYLKKILRILFVTLLFIRRKLVFKKKYVLKKNYIYCLC